MSFRQVTDILNASLSMYFALNLVLSESDNILMIISILITITLTLINFLHMLFTQLNILTANHSRYIKQFNLVLFLTFLILIANSPFIIYSPFQFDTILFNQYLSNYLVLLILGTSMIISKND